MHVEAVVKIYFTREYGRFKNVLGNRDLSQAKIKKLMRDITNGLDMLKYCPIIVDQDMKVIDGQHRLWVAKKLDSNVWYVILNETVSLYDIARMNSATERWKGSDFLKCYIQTGNKDYQVLEGFMQKYRFNLGTSIAMLTTGKVINGSKEDHKEKFENGTFKVIKLLSAEAIGDMCLRFKSFPGHNKREFASAIDKIMQAKKCDFDVLIKKFEANKEMLNGAVNYKQFIIKLEEIYNHHRSKREVIF